MISTLKYFTFFMVLTLLFSCETTPDDNTATTTETPETTEKPLSFERKTFERKGGECPDEHTKCAVVKLNYPQANNGNEQARNSINQFVNNMMLEAIVPDPNENIKDLETAAAQLIKYYQGQVAEIPEYELSWAIEVDGKVEIVKNYAVVTLPIYSFMGGAHPNHHTIIANFDITNGKELKLPDIVEDAQAFKELAEKRFIEARLAEYPNEEMDINDFFFGEGFRLPENFAVKNDGIFFYYNPYEAAPYALGTTEFTISFKDLEGIAKL